MKVQLPKFLRKEGSRGADSQGASAQGMVEFALILPFLLLLIFGAIELGRLLLIYSSVATASREAARYGAAAGDIGGRVAHFQDCDGIRSAAMRMGGLAGLRPADIEIRYDNGDPTQVFGNCPVGGVGPSNLTLGYRVRIRVIGRYQPIVPLVGYQPFPITSYTARTIVKDITIKGTPVPSSVPRTHFASSGTSVLESTGVVSVTVQLSVAYPEAVVVPFTVGGSATEVDDYSVVGSTTGSTSRSLVIPVGDTSATILVTVVDDAVIEGAESLSISLRTPSNAVLDAPSVFSVSIIDNDAAPTAYFAGADEMYIETFTSTLETRVCLDAPSAMAVTIPYVVSGTATEGDDYSFTSATREVVVPVSPNPTTTMCSRIFFNISDDWAEEPNETIGLTLLDPTPSGYATLGVPTSRTITIEDNDSAPTVSFTTSQQYIREGRTARLDVVFDHPTNRDINLRYTVHPDSTADEGSTNDFTVTSPNPILIPAGQTSASITINIRDDGGNEPEEFIYVDLLEPEDTSGNIYGYVGAISRHTVVVTPKLVTFPIPNQSKLEDGGTMTILVNISDPSSLDVRVPYTIKSTSTATLNTDYTLSTSGAVIIRAGQSSAEIILTMTDDLLDEDDETVILELGEPDNAALGTATTHIATIQDNDLPPTVSFRDETLLVAENADNVPVEVELSGPSSKEIRVPFTVSGTATPGSSNDFYLNPGTELVFAPGATRASILLFVINDALDEDNETVILTLGTPVNATLAKITTHTATIEDNDAEPEVAFKVDSSTILPVAENVGTVNIEVILRPGASGRTVTVPFTLTGSTATLNTDYRISPASQVSFAPGEASKMIQVTVFDSDGQSGERDETVAITLGTPVNAVKGTPSVYTLTIVDNDRICPSAGGATISGSKYSFNTTNSHLKFDYTYYIKSITMSWSSSTNTDNMDVSQIDFNKTLPTSLTYTIFKDSSGSPFPFTRNYGPSDTIPVSYRTLYGGETAQVVITLKDPKPPQVISNYLVRITFLDAITGGVCPAVTVMP